ncbi:MAG TPA: DUF115 domain-containing protein [Aeromonadales bacterium]|nr:DUF115 domain-containing protein [Aeromonadales bacterium]
MIELENETKIGKLISNQFGDQYLFSVNHKLFEQIDYETSFKRDYGDTFDSQDTLYIISGTDSGLLVKQLLKQPIPKGTTWLFIELPEVIEIIHDQYNLEDHEKIIVTTEENWEEEAQKVGLEIYFMLNKVVHIKSFAAQYYYLSQYLTLCQSIEAKISHLKWQYQSQLGSKIFTQRQLENLAENHTPAVLLKDYYKDKSALILAGGPSLDKYIPWIEEHQEQYLIIAVSRIARRLIQTRIKPDILVSVDPHISNFNVSKEIYFYEKNTLLVNQYHVSPQLLGNWLGKNVYLGNLLPWSSKLNTDNINGVGPTVTNTAILLAIHMGIKQQLLFGVDLCNSPEGFSHAKGSSEHESGPEVGIQGQTVITNSGKPAETNSAYFEAISTIAQLADLVRQTGGEIINPSPDSAVIDNVKHVTCDRLTIPDEKVSILDFLNKNLNHPVSDKISHYRNILKELKQTGIKLKKIRNKASKGLEYNKKLFDGDKPSENFKFKLKMDKIEKELNSNDLTELTELSKKFGVNEFLSFLNTNREKDWTNEEIKKSADTYYKALKSGTEELGRHIFTVINLLECRLLENNQLEVNREHLDRHLNSFKKSTLLDRKIIDQKNHIERNYNKTSKDQREADKRALELLIENKTNIIAQCKTLINQYNDKSRELGWNQPERIRTLSFFILMLSNQESQQTRRLYIFAKNNPSLCFIPDNRTILGHDPKTYIQRQNNINDQFLTNLNNKRKIYLFNQIKNIQDNFTPSINLIEHLKGQQAIILTDKESINKHQLWIEKNQAKFLIITTAGIIKYITSTSIIPDIIICGEYQMDNFEHIKSLFNYEKQSILVHPNHLLPTLTGNWFGLHFYMDNLFPWSEQKNLNISTNTENDKSIYDMEINLTLSFTQQCGFNKQYLLTGNHSEINQKYLRNDIVILKGDVSEALLADKSSDKPKLIDIFLKKNQTQQKISHYNNILTQLTQTHKKIKEINNSIQETLHNLESVINNIHLNSDIILIVKKLVSGLKAKENLELTEIFTSLCSEKPKILFSSLKMELKKDDLLTLYAELNWLYISAITLEKHIFTAINRTEVRLVEHGQLIISDDIINRHFCQYQKTYLLDHLSLSQEQKVLNDIKIKVDAYYNNNDSLGKTSEERELAMYFLMLTEQYGRDNHTRRIYIHETENKKLADFSNKCSIFSIPARELKNNFKKSFDLMLNSKDNKLNALEVKLYNLFVHKEIDLIKNIILGLEVIDQQEAQAFLHLARGYQYELLNNPDLAIKEYGLADSPDTIESALKRLVHISLNQGELEYAYDILKVLSEISPDYLPQLAELLVITKNYKDAIEIYSQYLEYNMSDISVLIKVGKLYEKQNIKEGAQFIYKHILELEPENQIAILGLKHMSDKPQ